MNKPNRSTSALVVIALLLILGLTGCQTAFNDLTTNKRDWDFVKSVGGMTLGKVTPNDNGGWYLNVNCNVSGLKKFSDDPTAVYENIACRDILAKTKGSDILLTLRTCIQSERYQDSAAQGADLGNLAPGTYSVYYANPDGIEHSLGQIVIPEAGKN